MALEAFNLAVTAQGVPDRRLVSEGFQISTNDIVTIQVRNETRIPALLQIHTVVGGRHDMDDGGALGLRFDARTLVHEFEVPANGYHLEVWSANGTALRSLASAFSGLGFPWIVLYGRKGVFVSVQTQVSVG